MQYTFRSFGRLSGPLFWLSALFLFVFLAASYGQTPLQCTPTATNLVIHAEGLAEPSGDIYLTCTGGTPLNSITSNITLTYNVPVTNRLTSGGTPDAVLTVQTTQGPVPQTVVPVLQNANTLAFNSVIFAIPSAGPVYIHITNVRVGPAVIGPNRQIMVNLSTTALPLTSAIVAVGTSTIGLLATYASSGIACVGSPVPQIINFANLLSAGTNFASTRVTEGFSAAFVPKDPTSDAGTRILVRYNNFPVGARIFIPDYVSGKDAAIPTAAGDLGGIPSPGAYTPGALLLARVSGADATGAGGAPISTAAAINPGTLFGSMTEIPLQNGGVTAVYEVIDANPSSQESAQFPTFIGLAALPNVTPVIATEALSFGPYNTTSTALAGLPVPRFVTSQPPNDCAVVGDCGANYFPVLSATANNLQFSVSPTGNVLTQFILVNNIGGGFMIFTTAVTYQGSATGWLTVTNASGSTNHTTLDLLANPAGLAQGNYQATVTIDAGQAGKQSFIYTFNIGAPQIIVSSVVNAASFQPGPLVAGSLATVKGTNFSGRVVSVGFGGVPGTILYNDAKQINVQVPASLASATSTQLVVTVDGNSSTATTVQLANINPGIFGVLNQDNSINSSANPAASGTIVQIFATGLISPVSSGPVVTGLGSQGIPTLYSGAAPNGVQQVNAQLPNNAASIPGVLVVCGTNTNAQLVCSPAFALYVK